MKKILSLLASVGLVATAAAGVVSCTETIASKDVKVLKADDNDAEVSFEENIFFEIGTQYNIETKEFTEGDHTNGKWYGVVNDDKSGKDDSEYKDNGIKISFVSPDKIDEKLLRMPDPKDSKALPELNTRFGFKVTVTVAGLKLTNGKGNFRFVSTYKDKGETKVFRSWYKFSVDQDSPKARN